MARAFLRTVPELLATSFRATILCRYLVLQGCVGLRAGVPSTPGCSVLRLEVFTFLSRAVFCLSHVHVA